jgi:hypothetical protein
MIIIFKRVNAVAHCEINSESEIVAHNYMQLHVVISLVTLGTANTGSINQKRDWIISILLDVMMPKAKYLCSKIVYKTFLIT